MDKIYDHKKVENKIYEYWEKNGYFRPKSDFDPSFKGEKFVIPIPPPNVTGILHTGHTYMLAIEDFLIRYKRMRGFNALWVPGTDHAGIATQNVVEKMIAKEGKNRHSLGRENFIKEVWRWKEKYHKNITSQIKAIGSSCDWSRERFTLDEGLSIAVKHAFVTLYDRGLIYKGEYMINWCPRCLTVLADDEVEHEEIDGFLWYFKYPFAEDSSKFITVATTRPETMLGDTAVAVNPKDKRYQKLIGKTLILPLMGRKITIIADPFINKDFGTGAVKVTPAHDSNDYQMALRHNLESIKVISDNGIMTKDAGDYAGYERYEAREAIIEEMDKLEFLEKIESHSHSVGHCYRCHTVIEPMLSNQWFVKTTLLSKKAIKSLKNKELKIIPKRFEKNYTNWLENMRDWCISRQLWWGHQIPAWYCKEKKNEKCRKNNGVIVVEKEPDSCPYCDSKKIIRDPDVLDTWFSSALWPFSILGWPDQTPDFKSFYPTTILETGYDILFFWVARMTMMGLELTGKSPFSEVYLHGLIRDKKGRKMSKSLGNVMDPMEIITEFGADSLRFTYLVGTTPGNDVNLSEDKIRGNRNFNNKIWNIARYISSDSGINEYNDLKIKTSADKWIVSKLQKLIKEMSVNINKYQISNAGEDIYAFIWDEFADWYLEISKTNRNSSVLYYCFENILKLLHPFNPYITEYLWEILGYKDKYNKPLIVSDWPTVANKLVDEKAEKGISLIMEIIKGVRQFKKDQGISPSTKIDMTSIYDPKSEIKDFVLENKSAILMMGGIKNITLSVKKENGKSSFYAGGFLCNVILGNEALADISKVKKRFEKELVLIKEKIEFIEEKLKNKEFVKKAPKEIVDREVSNKNILETEKENIQNILREL